MKFFPIYILLTIVTIAACTNSAQYYDYALSYVILFQLHDYIAKKILKQDPHGTNYFGNKEVGKFLAGIMRKGATQDWRKVLKDATGQEISAKAMVDYFQPLTKLFKTGKRWEKIYAFGKLSIITKTHSVFSLVIIRLALPLSP